MINKNKGGNEMKEIKESLNRYVEHKILPGGFLTSVLENDLIESVGKADSTNIKRLPEICKIVYWDLPAACWGSHEKVTKWLERK